MPRVPTKTFNDLFGMLANQKVTVKRTNKDDIDYRRRTNYTVVNRWTDPFDIRLRGRATFEENLLVAGKLAHPQIREWGRVVSGVTRLVLDGITQTQKIEQNIDANDIKFAIEGSMGSFEFARGSMVASKHYMNDGILNVSYNALKKEVQDTPPNSEQWIKSIQPNIVAKLLGKPELMPNTGVDLSAIKPLSDEDIKDENLSKTFKKFAYAIAQALKDKIEKPTGCETEPVEPENDNDTPYRSTEIVDEEGKEESKGGDLESEELEEQDPESNSEPDSEDSPSSNTRKTELEEQLDQAIEEAVQIAEDSFEEQIAEPNDGLQLTEDEVSEHEADSLARMLEQNTTVHEDVLGEKYWEAAPDLGSLSPPEDIGDITRKSSGLVTPDAWKVMLGSNKIFESTEDGDPQKLLVLADISGSTRDRVGRNKWGFDTVEQVIWGLSSQLLTASPNSESYGFSSNWGADMNLKLGQTAGKIPYGVVSRGGTPTVYALRWAVERANEEAVITLITDGFAEPGSALYVRQLKDQGHRIATVVVTCKDSPPSINLRDYGGDLACIFDVTDDNSAKALQDLFTNLLV